MPPVSLPIEINARWFNNAFEVQDNRISVRCQRVRCGRYKVGDGYKEEWAVEWVRQSQGDAESVGTARRMWRERDPLDEPCRRIGGIGFGNTGS